MSVQKSELDERLSSALDGTNKSATGIVVLHPDERDKIKGEMGLALERLATDVATRARKKREREINAMARQRRQRPSGK